MDLVSKAKLASAVATLALLAACSGGPGDKVETKNVGVEGKLADYNPERNAYFGDTHIHTRNSFDAYIFNVRATPDDAYRFAKGESVKHPAGYDIKLSGQPLDFISVTDHGAYLGILPAMADDENPLSKLPLSKEVINSDPRIAYRGFIKVGTTVRDGKPHEGIYDLNTIGAVWKDTIDAAERHNEPGKLTTFIGYEFTSGPNSANLHRNVLFRGSAAPKMPFTIFDSQNPEDLWTWMDKQREEGRDAIAIPHNGNVSDGLMFGKTTFEGKAMGADYAAQRMRNEPLVEMTQVKGTSETHPLLSPNDEWANFEIYEVLLGTNIKSKYDKGYVRQAYRDGLELAADGKGNPYKFGLIGASDTHVVGGSFDESKYWSKIGIIDGTAEQRGSVPPGGAKTWQGAIWKEDSSVARFARWGASGLAGVWAEQNSREAIFAAMQRKETFATSGSRMKLRFFASLDFADDLGDDPELVKKAYAKGVAMGGELLGESGKAPSFLLWAQRDPASAPLQRVQIVKGWVANGKSYEKVFDAACSDGGTIDAKFRCSDNGATVDLNDCSISKEKGARELRTLWKDPEFDAAQNAFYYVRVLENPTCRWSTWDALKAGVEANPVLQKTIQERAWSSPIWYNAPAS